jgi:hypothetical protein
MKRMWFASFHSMSRTRSRMFWRPSALTKSRPFFLIESMLRARVGQQGGLEGTGRETRLAGRYASRRWPRPRASCCGGWCSDMRSLFRI